ncbi:STAG-domain-containing protein [Zopfia rhizophila CBS 207.26]|uniref:STAG-domain-containing protein n=1 Tax=Zopfia rhizophila CBS 207.26 TaxID=1314779 RepID=A0A6A6EFV1_9PEZI|nr:STAG-domain-containing protein [Zopfia rhizophila CBS 207.26]
MSAAVQSSEGADTTAPAPRRKSGRVSKKPEPFVPASSPASSAKRKRNNEADVDIDIGDPSSEEEQEVSSEGEPDEEELRERRRKKKGKSTAKKPAPKKARTNGAPVQLAIRPATSKPNKPKKPRKAPIRKSAVGEEAEGLYAEVFARGNNVEDVASQWVTRFQEHEAKAVAEVVNFVLRSAGCNIKIDDNDVSDPDNCASRLGEIQEEYQAQNVSDYPLIAKGRGTAAFKQALHGFFVALVETIAASNLLFDNVELIENIEVWISTMSSASNRPFRHTSTVASLAVISALCRVASDIVDSTAKKIRQSETESKKSRVNKARVSAVNKEVDELNQKLEVVDGFIKDWFETVFIHRYRDVDPRIRVECVEALADWIMIYPDRFFDGSHLRYLGWVLSDTHTQTRLEVVKQLQKLFRDKDKLGGLKTFTERFRARIVEMATRDAEATVRASSVELLDVLREAGLLEPDDIDSVGRLIFDAEPKVRKAVVGFFAENVNSSYELQIEDMGGQEALDEALVSTEADDDFDNPRLEWLKLKCLVEQLLAYDSEDGDLPSQIERLPGSGAEFGLVAYGIESRFTLAAQALYDAIPEIRTWEILAGYLLYDHSQTVQNGAGEDAEMMLRQNCKLSEREENVLLAILNAAVKLRLTRFAGAGGDGRVKKTKAQRQAEQAEQEEAAKRLAVLIPRLLKKFGALPEAASLVLSLERALNLDVFQELRQDATLAALLDDINKQFLTHHNERVLLEAREAILHARGHDELKEMTETKVQALWDDTMNAFNTLKRGRDLRTRGSLSENILTGISNTVLRISNLVHVSDSEHLDQTPVTPANARNKSKRETADTTPPIVSLIHILDRGVLVSDLDPETDVAEDGLVRHAMNSILLYFVWKVRHWQKHIMSGTRIPDDELTLVAERRDSCIMALTRTMQSRKGADDIRIEASFLLLDLYNMFVSLKTVKEKAGKGKSKQAQARSQTQEEENDDWEALCQEIDTPMTKLLLSILTATESNFAKRAKKHIEEDDVDDDPVDPDDEPESSDDEEEDERIVEEKAVRMLMAENQLCQLGGRLVMAVYAGTLDGETSGSRNVKKRLERNKTRLGPNWKEVVARFDDMKVATKGKAAADKKAKAKESRRPSMSKEIVIENDSEEEEEEHRDEDEEMAEEPQDVSAEEQEENGVPERSPEVESVLGD